MRCHNLKPESLPTAASLVKLYEEKYTLVSRNWAKKVSFNPDINSILHSNKGVENQGKATPVLPTSGSSSTPQLLPAPGGHNP